MIGSKAAVNFSAFLFFHHPGRTDGRRTRTDGCRKVKKGEKKKGEEREKEIDADSLTPCLLRDSLFVGQVIFS